MLIMVVNLFDSVDIFRFVLLGWYFILLIFRNFVYKIFLYRYLRTVVSFFEIFFSSTLSKGSFFKDFNIFS